MTYPGIPASELDHIGDTELADRLFVMMCEVGHHLPATIRNAEWEALRKHLLERRQGPGYRLTKKQMQNLKGLAE